MERGGQEDFYFRLNRNLTSVWLWHICHWGCIRRTVKSFGNSVIQDYQHEEVGQMSESDS